MKTILAFWCCLSLSAVAAADVQWSVLKTLKDVEYRNAKLTKVEPDGIRIMHDGGFAKIPFEQLNEATKAQFKIDASEAEQFRKEQRDAMEQEKMERTERAKKENAIAAANQKEGGGDQEGPVTVSPSIRMEGKSVSYGRNTNMTWATTWGSFNKESSTGRVVEVAISTTARKAQRAQVEVVFVWKGADGGTEQFRSKGLVVATAQPAIPFIAAAQDEGDDTHDRYVALGIEQKTGERYVGWFARAYDATGRIVAVTASMKHLEKYASEVKAPTLPVLP